MSLFNELKAILSEARDIGAALSLMAWDQEVMMPKGGIKFRAKQLGTLSGLQHKKVIEEAGPLIKKFSEAETSKLNDFEKLNLTRIRWEFERSKKVPVELVIEISKSASEAQHAWQSARKNSDFSIFQPHLENLVALKLKEAEFLGYDSDPYDAHLESYEPGLTTKRLLSLFEEIKSALGPILLKIKNSTQVDDAFLKQPIDEKKQLDFSEIVLKKMGFDFQRGRQDISAHPFTINFSPDDVRITTRMEADGIVNMLYSSIHEGGHALYEQGLNPEYYELPAGNFCSLGIHESQSRIWENNVGRSLEFWEYFFEPFAELFPDKLKGKTPVDVFRAVNRAEPSLIRVAADELTYHFHIIMRFELEHDLMNRRLEVKDLPQAWNEKIKKYLGLEVNENRQGVLQDIHWSHGTFGYFPTYSLGSLYAAQFMATAKKEIPSLENQFINGEFGNFRNWLLEKIHLKGALYRSENLCEIVTGQPLNVKFFIDYAIEKFARIYTP